MKCWKRDLTTKRRDRLRPAPSVALLLLIAGVLLAQASPAESGSDETRYGRFFAGLLALNGSPVAATPDSLELLAESGEVDQDLFRLSGLEFGLALDSLNSEPLDTRQVEFLNSLAIQSFLRLCDELDAVEDAGSLPPEHPDAAALFLANSVSAASSLERAAAYAPLVHRVLGRLDTLQSDNEFILSLHDLLLREGEYPSLRGAAALIAAHWIYRALQAEGSQAADAEILRQMCIKKAQLAAESLKMNYGKAVAHYLLARCYESVEPERAWWHYQASIETRPDSIENDNGYFRERYDRFLYTQGAIEFLPAYFDFLSGLSRYQEMVGAAHYLLGAGTTGGDNRAAIKEYTLAWGEKSIRTLREQELHGEADQLFLRLQFFREM